jgi:hypothetical protein
MSNRDSVPVSLREVGLHCRCLATGYVVNVELVRQFREEAMSDATEMLSSSRVESTYLQLTCKNAPPKDQLRHCPPPCRMWGFNVQALTGSSGDWKGRVAGFEIELRRRTDFDVAAQCLATLLVTWGDRLTTDWMVLAKDLPAGKEVSAKRRGGARQRALAPRLNS